MTLRLVALVVLLAAVVPLGVVVAPAAAVAQATGSAVDREEVLARFEATRARVDAGDYEAALAELEVIHELLEGAPTQPTVLYNMARCYEGLFRYDEALRAYRRYLDEAGPEAARREEVESSIAALDRLLGTVEVTVRISGGPDDQRADPERVELWLDDRSVADGPGTLRVPGGRHVIEARLPGHEPDRVEITVAARRTVEVELTLVYRPPGRGLAPGYALLGVGLTIASLAVAVPLGVLAVEERDALRAGGVTADGASQRARRFSVPADILGGAAAALGLVTVVLLLLTEWNAPDLAPVAWLGPGGAGLLIEGSW